MERSHWDDFITMARLHFGRQLRSSSGPEASFVTSVYVVDDDWNSKHVTWDVHERRVYRTTIVGGKSSKEWDDGRPLDWLNYLVGVVDGL